MTSSPRRDRPAAPSGRTGSRLLESGNTSFPAGRYVVGFEPGADASSFTVRHRIEGAKLIEDVQLAKGLVQFVCTVASPISSYRVSHVSKSNAAR